MGYPVYNDVTEIVKACPEYAAQNDYHAMYSSVFSGIVTDPKLMTVPVDDHLVHRGDGVFEAFKMVDGKVFLLDEHLARLERSAGDIFLDLCHTKEEMIAICKQLAEVSGLKDILFRLYASRGPGGFTPNPYASVGPQLYLIASALRNPAPELYENGAKIGFSQVAIKSGGLAKVKTCNYISNVLMAKEAVDQKLNFVVNVTEDGFLGEGPTENIVYLNDANELIYSSFEHTLRGTTLLRLHELSGELQAQGLITGMKEAKQSAEELYKAKEVFMIGTTLDALPVVEVGGQTVGDGKPGPVAKLARELLKKDQQENGTVL
ncbi:aminotransferase class IV [Aliamphritea hakodatensis]|uniref:aminotransferase class IV n=1 Tax=Aliamphritea hakodatensis TaxID=2895352 RepID=UPI0022FD67CA|nr:aminotransferase class IV [Aliamphritea hakodatensis]